MSTALRSCSAVTESEVSSSLMAAPLKPLTAGWQTGLNDAGKYAGADRQDLVVERVAGIVHRHRAVMAEPEIGAGNGVQHVGEVLAAHLRLGARDDLFGIDHGAGDVGHDLAVFLLIDQHTEDVADVGLDL